MPNRKSILRKENNIKRSMGQPNSNQNSSNEAKETNKIYNSITWFSKVIKCHELMFWGESVALGELHKGDY